MDEITNCIIVWPVITMFQLYFVRSNLINLHWTLAFWGRGIKNPATLNVSESCYVECLKLC